MPKFLEVTDTVAAKQAINADYVINVKDYAGIDLTGATASDTAFQSIVNDAAAAAAAGAGNVEVYIPPGTLSLATRINVGAGVALRGAGRHATTIEGSSSDGVLSFVGAADMSVADLAIDASGSGPTNTCIIVPGSGNTGTERVSIKDCRFSGGSFYAVWFPFPARNVEFVGNIVEDCNGAGVGFDREPASEAGVFTENILIAQNFFSDLGASAIHLAGGNYAPGFDAPDIRRVFGVRVIGNQVRDFKVGPNPAFQVPIEFIGVADLVVADNVCTGPGENGISLGAVTNAVVTGNFVRDQRFTALEINGGNNIGLVGNVVENSESLSVASGLPVSDVIIANNIYRGSNLSAPKGTGQAINLPIANRVRITGNEFYEWEYLRSAISLGDFANADFVTSDVVIESNTFVAADPATPLKAVEIRRSQRTSVVRNTFRVARNLVATFDTGDNQRSVIDMLMDGVSETLIEGNHILFTGTVGAAPDAAGIGNSFATPAASPGLTVRRNYVIGGPRGLHLRTTSTDCVVYDNDTVRCAAADIVPATALGGVVNQVRELRDRNGKKSVTFPAVANAVNSIEIINNATGLRPLIRASGDDSNVGLSLVAKNEGNISLENNGGVLLNVTGPALPKNLLSIQAGGAGGSPALVILGEDSFVNLDIVTKGGGLLYVNNKSVSLNSTTDTHTAQQIELGHASDTTISRVSAGVIAVEGNTISTRLTNTATLDFGSVTAGSYVEQSITVTGAAVGDAVVVGYPAVTDGIVYSAYVSATNTVKVVAHNHSASAVDPASGTFRVTVIR